MSIMVELVGPDAWATWRDVRLQALLDSPSAFGSTYEREVAFDESMWRDRLGGDGVSVLAWREGEPAGMGGGFRDLPGFLHVVAMWTHPSHRSHGIGAAVLETIESWARERGLRLHLDVSTTNPRARALYLRCGYAPTGETRPLRDGSTERVERMVHAIASSPNG